MDFIFSVPYLFRIVLSLVGILAVMKLTNRLGVSMAVGIAVLAAWTGHSPDSAAAIVADRMFSLDTLFLVVVIAGVIWLSFLMSETGIMRDLVISLRARLPRRAILAALPAVVGLLPMPAGAMFSAPLVEDADHDKTLTPIHKVCINYWFRHVWEYWWPLYPGVLLAVDLTNLPIWVYVGVMSPLFLAALAIGYLFFLRPVPGAAAAGGDKTIAFLPLIYPTLTVIAVYGFLLIAVPGLGRFNKYLPMAVGVVCSLAVMQIQRPAPAAAWRRAVLSMRSFSMIFIIVLTRVYGAFIESRLSDGVFLMDKVKAELDVYGIPPLFLVVIIPFIAGLTTGSPVGFVGASFPVILSLAGPGSGGMFSTMVLAYSCGYFGTLLSPIHVCIIVTNEFFRTGYADSLRGIIRPVLTAFTFAALYSYLWSLWSG